MARVSSDEQALGYSLQIQEDNLKQYCLNHNILITKVFKEDHSAKNFNRPEFKEFLQFAKKNKSQIDYLLFTTWDRFSRNIQDAYQMIDQLSKLGIQPMAIQQPIDLTIPENKMMLAVYLVIPEIDNDRRSIKIREGIRKSLESGRWCHAAPRGYSYTKAHHNKSIIAPNEKARFIKLIFEEYALGASQSEIITKLRKRGFKIDKSSISVVLRNPVYIGKVLVPEAEDKPERLIEGIHQGIITPELFFKVQSKLEIKRRKMNLPSKKTKKVELPYRGLLICSKCGKSLTGSASRGRSGQRYFYYHCNHCKDERFRTEHADKMLDRVIRNFKIQPEVNELYDRMLEMVLKGSSQKRQNRIVDISSEIQRNEERINKLEDMFADGEVTPKDFSQMKAKYDKQCHLLRVELQSINETDTDKEQMLKKGVGLLSNLQTLWQSGDIDVRMKLLGSIFPEKLEILEKNCRTTRVNELLRLILQESSGLQKRKTGQLTPFLQLSRPVELAGIEPASKQGTNRLSTCLVNFSFSNQDLQLTGYPDLSTLSFALFPELEEN